METGRIGWIGRIDAPNGCRCHLARKRWARVESGGRAHGVTRPPPRGGERPWAEGAGRTWTNMDDMDESDGHGWGRAEQRARGDLRFTIYDLGLGDLTQRRSAAEPQPKGPTSNGHEWTRIDADSRIFDHEIGFPSPPRDRCPMRLFADAKRGHETHEWERALTQRRKVAVVFAWLRPAKKTQRFLSPEIRNFT
jgi:hypothetical protein